MASVKTDITTLLQRVQQPQVHRDAFKPEKLLLQQLNDAHIHLRNQEIKLNQALLDRQILEERVEFLELELLRKERSSVTAERARELRIKEPSPMLDETHIGSEEAKLVIEKLQQDRVTEAQTSGSRVTSRSSTLGKEAGIGSRRPYVCLIIDGDANHFPADLIKAGWWGGEAAAARLKQEVSKFIAQRKNIPQSCMVKVQVFMNRSGYVETIHRADHTPKDLINACLDRFFQTQPAWDLVDTGSLRESADTKIRANFNFFIRDSDCFATIMGTCSDNGYVQLLQEFQGDPDIMSKIVLLTSCNTVVSIQNLTYAIVQWPTVFRSRPVVNRHRLGDAGPKIKDVTPLEDRIRWANRNVTMANVSRSLRPSSGSTLPTGPVTRLPNIPLGAPSTAKPHPVISAPLSNSVQVTVAQEPEKRYSVSGDSPHIITIRNVDEGAHHSAATQMSVISDNVVQPILSKGTMSEEPDDQLLHLFDTPKMFARKETRSISFIGGLTLRVNDILPGNRFLTGVIASRMNSDPPFCSFTRPHQGYRTHQGEEIQTDPVAASHDAQEIVTAPSPAKSLEQVKGEVLIRSIPTHPATVQETLAYPSPSPLSFIHIPIPNRADQPFHDPNHFLFQQSAQYLASAQHVLQIIVNHARKYYNTIPSASRHPLTRKLQVGDFLISRLQLAQEIQKVEDHAIEQQICCSQPSTFRCGDAWNNDWYLYCSMSNAAGTVLDPALNKLSRSFAGGDLARMDWEVLMDRTTWMAASTATARRKDRRLHSRGLVAIEPKT